MVAPNMFYKLESFIVIRDRKSILFILLFLLFQFNTVAQLSKTEKKIIASVDRHNTEALRFLEKTVNINSGTMNFDGVFQVGQLFKEKLDALHFTTRWVDGKPFGRSGHLLAVHAGKGKTILLIGHLDTVFELESPFQKFTMLNDSMASGPGVADMKGGDVVIVQALTALDDAGLLKDMNVIVVMTGDEESSGSPLDLARHDLIEAAKTADIAIGFEDGSGNPGTAVISRRSSSGWELKVTGTAAHSSQLFTEQAGAGAIYEASRILNEFYKELSGEPNLTFNPGMILGGSRIDREEETSSGRTFGKNNIIADHALVTGDIRAMSPSQLTMAREKMLAIVAKHLPNTSAEIIFDQGYPPLAPTEGNKNLLKIFDHVSTDLGYGNVVAVHPRAVGAADISFTAAYIDMAIDGLGLGSSGGHTVNEVANLRTVSMQAKRAAVLMYRLVKK